jgi:Domain of unknown function (DUF4157)
VTLSFPRSPRSIFSFSLNGRALELATYLRRRGVNVLVHDDAASYRACGNAGTGVGAFCRGNHIFLGATVGTAAGPSLDHVLLHEMIHVAQCVNQLRTGRISSRTAIEREAEFLCRAEEDIRVEESANPQESYCIFWFVALAAAAYVLLRPGVANAPAPGERTQPSVSGAQVAGEAFALFALPEAVSGIVGRTTLGLLGPTGAIGTRMAVSPAVVRTVVTLSQSASAGATGMVGYRAVQDASTHKFSGVQPYIVDSLTGTAVGIVVPGGIMLAKGGTVTVLDWLATQGMKSGDFAMTQELEAAIRAKGPLNIEHVNAMIEKQRWTQSVSQWWLDRRGHMILYRGQDAVVNKILSPIARTQGVAESEALVAKMRAAGLTSEEIAGYTARWHTQPVPPQFTLPSLAREPLGAAGIPTTRLPGVAANFGDVYVLRMPKEVVIKVPNWGLAVEHEHVILNEIPAGCKVELVPSNRIPKLTVDQSGKLTTAK